MSYPGLAVSRASTIVPRWAADPDRSLLNSQTNSGIGEYEFSDVPVVESPEYLQNNEGRISGAAVGRYLEDYYTKFIQDRAPTR